MLLWWSAKGLEENVVVHLILMVGNHLVKWLGCKKLALCDPPDLLSSPRSVFSADQSGLQPVESPSQK